MADISKLAFLRTIWVLKDYLADIVIGGGWAPRRVVTFKCSGKLRDKING